MRGAEWDTPDGRDKLGRIWLKWLGRNRADWCEDWRSEAVGRAWTAWQAASTAERDRWGPVMWIWRAARPHGSNPNTYATRWSAPRSHGLQDATDRPREGTDRRAGMLMDDSPPVWVQAHWRLILGAVRGHVRSPRAAQLLDLLADGCGRRAAYALLTAKGWTKSQVQGAFDRVREAARRAGIRDEV